MIRRLWVVCVIWPEGDDYRKRMPAGTTFALYQTRAEAEQDARTWARSDAEREVYVWRTGYGVTWSVSGTYSVPGDAVRVRAA